MVTKPYLKSPKLRVVAWILLGVILAGLHTFAISWVRMENHKNYLSSKAIISEYFTDISNGIGKRVSCEFRILPFTARIYATACSSAKPQQEPENFQDWVKEQVDYVCSVYYPDIPSNYILAIIYHESRFDPSAVNSKTGAVGLMQILPKWHLTRAEKLGVSLTDPAGNILTGCDILNEAYRQSGSFSYALNVYAGGYPYADAYMYSQSPFELELLEILESGVLEN